MLPVACVWNTWDGAAGGVEGMHTESSQVQKMKEFYLVFLFFLCLFF